MAFGLLAAFAGGSLIEGDVAFLAMTGGSIAAFIGLADSLSVHPLAVKGTRGDWLRVKGCSEEFLSGLPGA